MTTADRPAPPLLADFDARRPAALARAVSIVENRGEGAEALLAALHPRLGRARRIGITGPPGAGKSTITMQLVRHYRDAGFTAGVVAVDPTSPFTGGAILGDRVRMESVALDSGVFIRSMATRGSLGGLSAATRDVCDVLDAFGFDRIIIETVGVGQSELEIARTADSSAVVLVPESGDAIQALKAGLMEIADVFVVNKSDRPGADKLARDIETTVSMRARADGERWTPPVLKLVASKGEGVSALADALDRHFALLAETGMLRVRRRRQLVDRVRDAVEQRVRRRLLTDDATARWLEERIGDLESGALTPLAAAIDLLEERGAVLRGSDE